MKKNLLLLCATLALATASSSFGALITAVPGPDDQGGMIMPMFTISATAGTGSNPTAGTINMSFSATPPVLKSLQEWSPDGWFAEAATWRPRLGSPAGVGGTPLANAGAGGLFNNQYGVMFMSMGTMMMANIPTGKSLAIKLTSISSLNLESFNYSSAANRWDQVWSAGVGSQVLWNGSMWHNYYTLPAASAAGTYSASYEIFIANTPFTGGTGFAQYDAAADAATKDINFTAATLNYSWTVIPEPSTYLLLAFTAAAVLLRNRPHRRRA